MAAIEIRKGNKEKKRLPEKRVAVSQSGDKSIQERVRLLESLVLDMAVIVEKQAAEIARLSVRKSGNSVG